MPRILFSVLLPQMLAGGLCIAPLLKVLEYGEGSKHLLGMGTESFQCLLGAPVCSRPNATTIPVVERE